MRVKSTAITLNEAPLQSYCVPLPRRNLQECELNPREVPGTGLEFTAFGPGARLTGTGLESQSSGQALNRVMCSALLQ